MPERAFLALSGSERQRVERVDALTAAGSGSIAQLLDMLADTSWTVRRAVIASLAALGREEVQRIETEKQKGHWQPGQRVPIWNSPAFRRL